MADVAMDEPDNVLWRVLFPSHGMGQCRFDQPLHRERSRRHGPRILRVGDGSW